MFWFKIGHNTTEGIINNTCYTILSRDNVNINKKILENR